MREKLKEVSISWCASRDAQRVNISPEVLSSFNAHAADFIPESMMLLCIVLPPP